MNHTDVEKSKEIILLVGLPGSGKSTWVKSFLSTHSDYVVVSSDDIIDAYAKSIGKTYTEVFSEYMGNAEVEYKIRLMAAIREKKNIIVDRTNLNLKSRRKILSSVPKEYKKVAVVFSTPIDEVKRRLIQREYETGKAIPGYVLDSMIDSYIEPTTSEGFDEIIKV
jgi:tRNA uridine 5-carbamoylmethylation protein Kti12